MGGDKGTLLGYPTSQFWPQAPSSTRSPLSAHLPPDAPSASPERKMFIGLGDLRALSFCSFMCITLLVVILSTCFAPFIELQTIEQSSEILSQKKKKKMKQTHIEATLWCIHSKIELLMIVGLRG